MAISKAKKQELLNKYVEYLKSAHNAVVVKQHGVDVNTSNNLRKEIKSNDGKYIIVRKRLLLKALSQAGLSELEIGQLPGSLILLTSENSENEFGPLKALNKVVKTLSKDGQGTSSYEFLGGWFDKIWKDGSYVNELANVPSKEELISKLLYMLKYSMQSLVSVVDQIAKKSGEQVVENKSIPVVESVSETVATEPVVEAVVDQVVVEPEIKSDEVVEAKSE